MSDNGEFKIEKGVPVPIGNPAKTKFPFGEMNVGDSFVSDSPRLSAAAVMFGKYHNMKFKTLKCEGGRRVWRVA